MKKIILIVAVLLVAFIYAGAHWGALIDNVEAGGLDKRVGGVCPSGKECYA